ncbi:hypothetical protein HA402_001635 [Bradysia odoriphaga]|nr:hypothetical protein HA402_001635 [Bradysia odoriphaga]
MEITASFCFSFQFIMTRRKRGLCDWFNLIAAIWFILSDIFLNGFCLRELKIFVPEAVIMGNAATLSCQYDLEQAVLYSVRWYFEGEEFYRYVPKESPPARVFTVSGISVDLSSSDSTQVTLRSVTRDLSGQFLCEVSEDAPLFHTEIRISHMQVVELPNEDPFMQIDKKVLGSNDSFKASCTVGKSYPSANITWYINDRKVYKTPFQRIVYRSYEGTATYSSLELYPHSQILQDAFQAQTPKYLASLNILCEVSILHVYHKNVQQRVLLGNQSYTTVSPNLLGLDGSKHASGDPDNSPLTGHSVRNTFSKLMFLFIICYCFGEMFL